MHVESRDRDFGFAAPMVKRTCFFLFVQRDDIGRGLFFFRDKVKQLLRFDQISSVWCLCLLK